MTLTVLPVFTLKLYELVCPVTTVPGGVLPNPSNIWFPVVGTVTALPSAPAVTVNPEIIPVNSAIVDACFDPDDLDYSQIFNNLLPQNDTVGTYDQELDTGVLIRGKDEIIPVRAQMRLVFGILSSRYDLTPVLTPCGIVLRTPLSVYNLAYELSAGAGAYNIASPLPALVRREVAATGEYTLNGSSIAFTYVYNNPRILTATVGEFLLNDGPNVLALSSFDTDLSVSVGVIDTWYTTNDPDPIHQAEVSNAYSRFGGSSLRIKSTFGTHVYAYLPWQSLKQYDTNFTYSCYMMVTSNTHVLLPFCLGDQTGADGFIVYYGSQLLYLGYVPAGQTYWGDTLATYNIQNQVGTVDGEVFYHFTIEQEDNGIRVYWQGVPLVSLESGTTLIDIGYRLDLRNAVMLGSYSDIPGDRLAVYTSRGYLDNVRLVQGALHKGAAFTPPTQAYTSDSIVSVGDTLLGKRTRLAAASNSFSLTGFNLDFILQLVVFNPEAAVFSISGQSALFTRAVYSLSAEHYEATATFYDTVEVNVQAFASQASDSFLIMYWPDGTSIGDVCIAVIETSAADNSLPIQPVYGWTTLFPTPIKHETDLTAPAYLQIMYRVCESDPAGICLEVPRQKNHIVASLISLKNVENANPIQYISTEEALNGFSFSFPSINEPLSQTVLLYIIASGTGTDEFFSFSLTPGFDGLNYQGLATQRSYAGGDGGTTSIHWGYLTKSALMYPSTSVTSPFDNHLIATLVLRPKL